MRFLSIFIFVCIFFFACQQTVDVPVEQKKIQPFFDIKTFFKKEIARLSKVNTFHKTVAINGVEERKSLETIDLENELSIFIASDINRPAWADRYKIDSIWGNTDLQQLHYTALDESLKTQKVSIHFKNKAVAKVLIEKRINNAVAQSKQLLSYEPQTGYSIQNTQSLSFTEPKTIFVSVLHNSTK